jgi:hypothetical protein
MQDPTPAIFDADHAFDFLIVDNKTGSLLFMGREADPGGTLLSTPLGGDAFFASSSDFPLFTMDSPAAPRAPALLEATGSSLAPAAGPSSIAAVPEPSTFVLLLVGILSLMMFAERHARRKADGAVD